MDGIADDDDVTNFVFATASSDALPRTWILLDNQSTVNTFCNKQLLRDIHETDTCVRVRCNAGVTRTNKVGTLPRYPGKTWYHPNGIANILSMTDVERYYPVTYRPEKCFIITKPDGAANKFVKSDRGLHYMDAKRTDEKEDIAATKKSNNSNKTATEKSDENMHQGGADASESVIETSLVTTVEDKKSNYTVKGYRKAELAHKLQTIIGRPSPADYQRIVGNSELMNCPITTTDLSAAHDVFGPNLGSLKGKTVKKSSPGVECEMVSLAPDVMQRHKNVTLAIDIMFVNKLAFLVTTSHDIKFGTVEFLPNRTQGQVLSSILRVRQVYAARQFTVTRCHADLKFEPLDDDLKEKGIHLNLAAEGEHVPEGERYIRTIKERTRAIWNTVPFTRFPSRMVIEMVTSSVFWLNMFPVNDGISMTMSPRTIITGLRADYNKHCRIKFGAYVQTHEEHDNSMITRTTGAIALRPTGNAQGGYYFYSLSTGRRIFRMRWTELPMPQEVIDRVHVLARRSNDAHGLAFGWRDSAPIGDDDDNYNSDSDSDFDPDEEQDNESIDDGSLAGVNQNQLQLQKDNEDDDEADIDDEEDEIQQPNEGVNEDDPQEQPATEVSDDNDSEGDHVPPHLSAGTAAPNGSPRHVSIVKQCDSPDTEDDGGETAGVTDAKLHAPTGVPTKGEAATMQRAKLIDRGTLRSGRVRSVQAPAQVTAPTDFSLLNYGIEELEHTALTQYSVKKGLEVFGRDGAEAVLSEMRQLHDRHVIVPKKATMLTRDEKKSALEYLMFLKRKRCGRIKGRGCADGRKQRVYKKKEDTSSPTVTTEGLFLSCVIDAKERRVVATCDIPGAFMQADMDESIHMRLAGPLAMLLTKVDSEMYSKYVVMERSKPVIYVKLSKALYGTLQASLLFWKDLTGKLKEWGFEMNPYDTCVANKTINGKQCTVLWHVDDLKISHVDGELVDNIINLLKEKCGKDAPLTVTRGKVHEYLGMTIDYSVDGKVIIRMDDYVAGVIDEARADMSGEAPTPAAEHLYDVRQSDRDLLDAEDGQHFHAMVAKLL